MIEFYEGGREYESKIRFKVVLLIKSYDLISALLYP